MPVIDRGSLQGSEMLRIPYFLYNQLIDNAEVVSFSRRPAPTLLTRKRFSASEEAGTIR
jgi:hypothetical protein